MFKNYIKVQKIIPSKNKKKLILSLFVKFLVSITEMLSIISFIPFLSLVANKENFLTNSYILKLIEKFHLEETEIYLFLILVPLILIVFLNLLRPFSVWYSSKINSLIWIKITSDLFNYYLNKDYLYHVENGSNVLLEKLLQRSNSAIAGVVFPVYEILGCIFSSIFIIAIPIIYNPFIAVISLLIIIILYVTLYKFFRKKIIEYGKYSPQFSKETYKLVEESFKSYKDIKIKNNQDFFLNQFLKRAKKFQNNAVNFDFFSSTPRAVTEVSAFSFALVATLILLINSNYQLNQTVIVLGVYLLATQRLVPVIQNFFSHYSKIKFHEQAFNLMYEDLVKSNTYNLSLTKSEIISNLKPKFIKFDKIKFLYPNNEKFKLEINNLVIKKGDKIGITGKSGFGKSTFLNILSGLLTPNEGKIFIDKIELDKNNIRSLQKSINYVPQNVFILNDTIKKNIAFGLDDKLIDKNKVKKSADLAGISQYIEKELDQGYETIVGENAIKLSGGQRQRIGLARAFYEDKEILILDEATNSLDKDKELEIMGRIMNQKEKTIIFVSHNSNILSKFNKVINFDKGVLKN